MEQCIVPKRNPYVNCIFSFYYVSVGLANTYVPDMADYLESMIW